jgi:uncharacterized protein (TIGR00369 family)
LSASCDLRRREGPRIKERTIDELVGEFGREGEGPSTGPFAELLGYRTRISAAHGAYVELEVEERHLSMYGVAHGGVALVLLDTVGGVHVLAARPELARIATISLSVNFIGPVRPGRVVATAAIQRIGGAVAYTSMALRAGDFDGEILATAHGAYRLFHAARG